MSNINWNGGSGDWVDAADWTPQQVPGASDSATISGTAAADVLVSDADSITVSGLVLNDGAGTLEVDGYLAAGTITLTSGLITGDGTIANTAIVLNGGSLGLSDSVFQNDTIVGTLAIGDGDDVVVQGGFADVNADGTPGTISLTGADATLEVADNETIDNVTIAMGNASDLDTLQADDTLTLGQGVLLETAPSITTDMITGAGTIINEGSLLADGSTGTVILETTDFDNEGAITVTGGQALEIQVYGTFANDGSFGISSGSTVTLTDASAFTNTGSIQVGSGSELDLYGYSPDMSQGQTVGGTVEVDGILDAGGNTISLDATGAFSELDNDGTIENATLVLNGGSLGLSDSVFQNDIIVGTLAIGDGDDVVVQSGFADVNADGTPGTISLTGADATLEVADNETIDNVTIVMGNATDLDTLQADGTLTLGQGVLLETAPSITTDMITGAGTIINEGSLLADGSTGTVILETTDFDNEGAITVTGGQALEIQVYGTFANDGSFGISSGSTVTLTDASAFTNTGSIQVGSGSELDLYGYSPDMSQGQTVGGTVEVDGVLDAGGNTISLDATGAFSELDNDGTIENATLVLNGGMLGLSDSVFQADTIIGALAIGDGDDVVVQGGFADVNADGTPGTISLTGADATLEVADNETIDNVTIVMGNASDLDTLQADGTLTLGQGVLLETAPSITTDMITGAGTIINEGSLLADGSTGTVILETTDFDNEGAITVTGGQALEIQVYGTFANDGSFGISSGSTVTLTDASAFTNTGSIQVGSGSELDLYGYSPDLSQGQTVGGTVEVDGVLDAGGNTISLDATGAFSELDNDGTIENATLVLNGGSLGLSDSVFQNDIIVGTLAIGDGDDVVVQSGFADVNADGTPGTISLTGADATLEVADNETLNATIVIGNATDLATLQVDSTLTLGSASVIETASATTTDMITGAGTVINDGTVTANAASGTLIIGTTDFTNAGALTVTNGGSLQVQTYDGFFNTGTLSVMGGGLATIADANTVSNSGAIVVNGGSLVVDDLLQGSGVISLSSSGGVEFGAGVEKGQTVQFTDGSDRLVLDDAADFAGVVSGFQSGDSIELTAFAGATETYADGVLTFTQSSTVLGIPITTVATIQLEGSYQASDFTTTTDADGNLFVTTDVLPCFASGTLILTEAGEVAVETLREGDSVVTVTEGERRLMPITWIGHRAVDIARHPAPEKVRPVRVQRGAFAPNLPARDLLLSPDHAIHAEGILVPVKYLINGTTIRMDETVQSVVYFHVQLERHEILLCEGLPAESYLESGGRGMFANGGQPVVLHADFSHIAWDVLGCAPLKVTGPEVERIRAQLGQRARRASRAAGVVSSRAGALIASSR